MEEYEPVIDVLVDVMGDYKSHNKNTGQMSFDCPVCSYEIKGLDEPDGKGNLEVNYVKQVYKCWSCADTHDTHGSIFKLVKHFGNTKQLRKLELLLPEEVEVEKKVYKRIRLPKEFVAFKDASTGLKMTPIYKSFYNYLKKRNISDHMIVKYNIGFCYMGEYANRVIVPSYDKDEVLNYFVGRSIEEKPKRKYKNPEAEKKTIIFNEHLIDWNKPVHLVEGPFDHIFLDNSIPMLGKYLSDSLFDLLYDNAKKIIMVLDGDAWMNTEKLYDKLNGGKLFGKVWAVRLPKNLDIADLRGDYSQYPPFQLY